MKKYLQKYLLFSVLFIRLGEIPGNDFLDESEIISNPDSGTELNQLQNFINHLDEKEILCSDSKLDNKRDEIHYLYRIAFLSYLYESAIYLRSKAVNLGMGEDTCSFDWEKILKSCHPGSEDMKKFVDRSLVISKKQHALWNYRELTLDQLKKNKKEIYSNLQSNPQKSLAAFIFDNKDFSQWQQSLDLQCLNIKKMFSNTCMERDLYYGLPGIPLFEQIISQTSVLSTVDESIHVARACLHRFASASSHATEPLLPSQWFQLLHAQISNGIPVQQETGRLFIAGALKEFDDKGVKDIIPVAQVKVPPSLLPVAPPPVPVVLPVEVREIIPPVPVPPSPPVEVAVIEKKEEIRWSSFKEVASKRRKENLNFIDVDMKKLKDDFILNRQEITEIKKELVGYETRDALMSMKKLDKLGQFVEPVRLLFLKILIEENNHQSLHNIISVLGREFWLLNDIDGESDGPEFVELLNDKSTNLQWVIRIKRSPNKVQLKLQKNY